MEPVSPHFQLEQTDEAVHLKFENPQKMLSSAVLNGGLVQANHIVNMKVLPHENICQCPEITLSKYCESHGWGGTCVGMMTAASMGSLRIRKQSVGDIDICVMVTVGLSNARRAGDVAEYQEIHPEELTPGTINMIAHCSASLTDAAMVEACMILTESKAAALQDAKIMSPVSHQTATGTGTDSLVICSSARGPQVRYCGKHVLLGEILGRLAYEAISSSIGPR